MLQCLLSLQATPPVFIPDTCTRSVSLETWRHVLRQGTTFTRTGETHERMVTATMETVEGHMMERSIWCYTTPDQTASNRTPLAHSSRLHYCLHQSFGCISCIISKMFAACLQAYPIHWWNRLQTTMLSRNCIWLNFKAILNKKNAREYHMLRHVTYTHQRILKWTTWGFVRSDVV